ncbi:ribose transport system substrate-binding protein [Actinoplanes philippinensis]|uniref:Ribose transport system substrate-binding protein n=2 Tax=Actinoplanes philippinensis TaxID=35752 RepID=A0A1I2I2Z5_9ACTN|nr:ribose transport system substrate-binding protein [Actinoplanes philippinensis]
MAAMVLLGACSDEPSTAPPPAVLVVAGRQVDFVAELSAGFSDGVHRVSGVSSQTTGPGIVDNAAELRTIQGYLTGERGSLTLFTFAPELFADSLDKAAAAGTPVIALHSVPAPGSRVPLYIGNDNRQLGTWLGEAMANRMPADAKGVVILGSPHPGISVLDDRASGVREALQRLRPQVTVMGPFDTKQPPAPNMQAWRTLQAANPDALAFVGVGGQDAHNLAHLREPGTTRVDGGFGTDSDALKLAQDGSMLLVSTEPYLQGLLAGALQARHAKTGDPLPTGWLPTPGILINSSNAARVIARQATPAAKEAWFKASADMFLDDVDSHMRSMDDAR